jgi:hypothetical protein
MELNNPKSEKNALKITSILILIFLIIFFLNKK